ncbi:uncharacterized protein VICG_01431 [Vittaforma corneae ATCC 50505]|uniref:Uncharacterized protein n=1 Tax=Vittaforma corneae (strain ATCC 50505) TaxID=993615 RepID=L2GMN5_VITCO|nr:uncharacterized protein VICG_01431 [Vittaforma corneae ATCC 50505]ELA41567.1 hypothetical protein VICG_01431 [Vittaforma corneae ATCC 50505]
MRSKRICVYTILASIARAEIFVPEDVNESDLANANAEKSEDNYASREDPFSASLLPEEENDESINSNRSNLIENEQNEVGSNLSESAEQNTEPDLTKDNNANDLQQDQTAEQNPNVSKLVSSSKMGVPYWTEVVLNKQKQSVLVNVKTVTIIESVAGAKVSSSTRDQTQTAADKKEKSVSAPKVASVHSTSSQSASSTQASPYIKIQMPTPHSSVSKPATLHKASTTKTITSSVAKKSSAPAKSASAKSSSAVKSVSQKSKSASHSSVVKEDAFAKHSSSRVPQIKTPASTKSANVDTSTSVGSIFDILKNLPSGGKESESVFVEGSFKFPKKKEINDKVFKLSGYISTS